MASFPKSIEELMTAFRKLPGVGPKTAERFALYITRQPVESVASLAQALVRARSTVVTCATCFTISEKSPCLICADRRRDASILCVVAEPQDLLAIERTGEFKGYYHVLGGVLNPIEGITPEQLKIKELLQKVQGLKHAPYRTGGSGAGSKVQSQEIILALDLDMEGEATVLYLKKLLTPFGVRVTRLARGLPMGADLEYADDVTLVDSIRGRREV